MVWKLLYGQYNLLCQVKNRPNNTFFMWKSNTFQKLGFLGEIRKGKSLFFLSRVIKKLWVIKNPRQTRWADFLCGQCVCLRFFIFSLFLIAFEEKTRRNFSNIAQIMILEIFNNSQKPILDNFTIYFVMKIIAMTIQLPRTSKLDGVGPVDNRPSTD